MHSIAAITAAGAWRQGGMAEWHGGGHGWHGGGNWHGGYHHRDGWAAAATAAALPWALLGGALAGAAIAGAANQYYYVSVSTLFLSVLVRLCLSVLLRLRVLTGTEAASARSGRGVQTFR